jgi:hypothetical protein
MEVGTKSRFGTLNATRSKTIVLITPGFFQAGAFRKGLEPLQRAPRSHYWNNTERGEVSDEPYLRSVAPSS